LGKGKNRRGAVPGVGDLKKSKAYPNWHSVGETEKSDRNRDSWKESGCSRILGLNIEGKRVTESQNSQERGNKAIIVFRTGWFKKGFKKEREGIENWENKPRGFQKDKRQERGGMK